MTKKNGFLKFFIKTKKNPSAIYLRFIGKSFDLKKTTTLLIDPEKWSTSKRQPINSTTELRSLGQNLLKLKTFIIDAYNTSINEDIDTIWLGNVIKTYFNGTSNTDVKSKYVVDAIAELKASANTRKNNKGEYGLSKSRITSYNNLLNLVVRYQENNKLKVKEVDPTLAMNFIKWMQEQDYSKSYYSKIISDLKMVCREAGRKGAETSPKLLDIKASKPKPESILYLNRNEIKEIKKTKLNREALKNARRWLLLGCELGQRGGDLLNINSDKIKTLKSGNRVIELVQQKTNKSVTIPILHKAEKILKKGIPNKISMQTFNLHIKDICKKAKIDSPTSGRKFLKKGGKRVSGTYPKWQLASSHICRRSYASNYYGEYPTPLLMSVTGHSTESQFLNYIGKSGHDQADQFFELYSKRKKNE
ncbi:integrase [Nonlabens ulvanivorans]|uniref:Integrase n=1 Tax=Nonlabens ulvanivorans TaxID=906888 RepID=A0A081D6B0_NONUL|nr:phage integrase SAM-like domain-containing protein [Nonlabens ulvanivorans]GAK74456.1 integrase [Nonlabens ulvanivorans]